jgi:tRNA uridine 5-carbamoylmethylation protein Kti12
MVKVVVVNGRPGVGKTTFEQMCQDICYPLAEQVGFSPERPLAVSICSTVDFVKHIATICGWDGTKTLENRKFLSDLKDLLTTWGDIPFKTIQESAEMLAIDCKVDWILFVDCREPAEIQKLKERLNATTVIIRREEVEGNEVSNHADAQVFNYTYDVAILNDSDIIHLEDKARKFIEYMKKEEVPYYVNVD